MDPSHSRSYMIIEKKKIMTKSMNSGTSSCVSDL